MANKRAAETETLTEAEARRIIEQDPAKWSKLLTPRMNGYFHEYPTTKQAAFLLMDGIIEAFYGGAGGGGKSSALLMGALQYVDDPEYSALILRRTYTDLCLPGALIDRSHEWLDETPAKWDDRIHTWTFPSGAKVAFGYLDHRLAHMRYRSAQFQYIAFDELTEFDLEEGDENNQYLFLYSRLRRRKGQRVPLRVRSASNPGGPGHSFVKNRFVVGGPDKGRVFVPAKIRDNPHIDQKSYEKSLSYLPPVVRMQIMDGNWDVTAGGKVINRLWFRRFLDDRPVTPLRVRSWDLAASASGKRTAGVMMSRMDPNRCEWEYTVEDVITGRWTPGERDDVILQQARIDGKNVIVLVEEEPGSGGKAQVYNLKKKLAGFRVEEVPVQAERAQKVTHLSAKVRRAGPFASQAEIGNIALMYGDWVDDYLDELNNFPDGIYSDQVDASSQAFNWLSEREYWDLTDREERQGRRCECGRYPHEDWCEELQAEREEEGRYSERRQLLDEYGPGRRP